MTPKRFSEMRDLFEAALRQSPEQRVAWLREACHGDQWLHAEVERLLLADGLAEGGLTLTPRVPLASSLPAGAVPALESRRVGQYEIIRELGRGGMGVVYLAKRADHVFSKPVAIKFLRPGTRDTQLRWRFDQEREIVARLDHPNIARLLDGGTTEDGLPYSVIEYVDGQPIDLYCDERRLNVSARLSLLRTVCAAVQYAHQHLVVHRDLKPSNILVTPAGTVKLLDFGIAKVLDSGTDDTLTGDTVGLRPLTIAYASPEQISGGRISTSSDVYSLGVVLYELLTGQRPHAASGSLPHQLIQAVSEGEPLAPSEAIRHAPEDVGRVREGSHAKLRRRLHGELGTIVMMALRKEPNRRYSSVEAFSEDIGRHLSGLPVLAQTDSVAYRARKFVGRHRAGVVAAVLVLLSMAAAVAGTSWQARVASQERRHAEDQATQARLQSERAERQTREADRYRLRAESEAEFARSQLRLAEQRTREAALEREKAGRRARSVQTITQSLLELQAILPDVPGGTEAGRRAAAEAERTLLALRSEGFTDESLGRDTAAAREAVRRYEALRANITTATPTGWEFITDDPDDYEHGLDRTYDARGAAAFIKNHRPHPQGLATLVQTIDPMPYAGKRVRVSASLRSNAVERSGGLLFQVVAEDGTISRNLRNLALHGTHDWGPHAVVFDVPAGAREVAVGFALSGPGAVWADDFSIETVDASTPSTRKFPSAPVDRDFEPRKP